MIDQQAFLDWRGVQDACEECQGTGIKVYGSTATFWGGIGGAAMTQSVCNHCWGSGDKYRPWKSWKLIEAEKKEQAPMFQRLRISAFKLIRSGYCNDTCSSQLGEYPCDCWKAKLSKILDSTSK